MSVEHIIPMILVWAGVAIATVLARLADTDDASGSIAAGVLWPVYLPYRLYLLIRAGKP